MKSMYKRILEFGRTNYNSNLHIMSWISSIELDNCCITWSIQFPRVHHDITKFLALWDTIRAGFGKYFDLISDNIFWSRARVNYEYQNYIASYILCMSCLEHYSACMQLVLSMKDHLAYNLFSSAFVK